MNFNAFVNDIEENKWNVFGAEVYVDGKLVHQYGDTTTHRYPIYSATKTITSIAVGMAIDEGKLDIHKSVLEYLPESATSKMSKPQLEIYADDVKCSHGATIGRLNEEEQFYMRSRGITLEDAKVLQMISFLAPVLENIPESDRACLSSRIEEAIRTL